MKPLITSLVLSFAALAATPDYQAPVRKFADTLLAKGLDVVGSKHTPLWAGVIDARTFTVPERGVPAPRGIRESDRAVGGANLYHDVVTLRVFHALSALTGDARYSQAARDYVRAYLDLASSPATGALGWGEHLYYNFFRDEVAAERKNHELLEWTPPWDLLWEANSEATRKEIAALRYHFYADDPSALFNRHASWSEAVYQKPGGQPWIKHSGLYAHAFLFLYSKTNDAEWLKWSRGPGALYWNHRNPRNDLTLGCIGDSRPSTQDASTQMPELAYWLHKAYRESPDEKDLRDRALTFMKAYNRYFYDRATRRFLTSVGMDGVAKSKKTETVWNIAYGDPGILPNGRIEAYFARVEKDAECLAMARRVAELAAETPMPEGVSLEGVAFALNLNLDLYDITREKRYLKQARRYADFAIQKFWVSNAESGLFVREAGDHYYEAKSGTGDLLAGLLRLDLRLHPKRKDPGVYDWSF
jgi:hypothetical protein